LWRRLYRQRNGNTPGEKWPGRGDGSLTFLAKVVATVPQDLGAAIG
jgi:hypothetical protein